MKVQLLFAFVLIFKALGIEYKEGDQCVTPNKENGTCLQLKDCAIILAAISTFNPEAFQFVLNSQCGTVMGLVCCGTSAYSKDNINLPLTPESNISFTTPLEEEEVSLSDFSNQTVCGLEALAPYRIKGGFLTQLEEFPWMAALEYISMYDNENAGIRCSGSLINDRYVLTAAHCIVHVEFVVIKAWLGVTNITSDANCLNLSGNVQCINSTQKLNVSRVIPHERYNRSLGYNDIGLLQLENQIKFTDYIRPICLPSPNLPSPRIGIRLTIAGWGETEYNTPSDVKLKLYVPVRPDGNCNKIVEIDREKYSSTQLCAGGEKGKSPCQGDSGGCLMKDFTNMNEKIQWYQVGIFSYGAGCTIGEHPAVYTKVSRYIAWIVSKIDEVITD